MKSFILLSLACLLTDAGVLRGADGDAPPTKKDAAVSIRAAAALDMIQKALRDLPPGADVDQIKKALARIREQVVKDLQGRLMLAKADLEMFQERAAWSQRMATRGYLPNAQAKADNDRALTAFRVWDRLRAALKKH